MYLKFFFFFFWGCYISHGATFTLLFGHCHNIPNLVLCDYCSEAEKLSRSVNDIRKYSDSNAASCSIGVFRANFNIYRSNFPETSASSIEVSTLNIFGSTLKGGNPLPEFVDMTIKERTIDSIDINCPDDIWDNLINQSYPKLPYLVVDNYDRKGADMRQKVDLPVIIQESKRSKAIYSLSQGGKILHLFEKKLQKDVIFRNPVFQPANLGRLNAWTSGGVEWNWPRLGRSCIYK